MAQFFGLTPLNAAAFESGAASDGQVLSADGSGAAEWRDVASGGGGATDITYADLVTAIGASTLTVGGFYRITDFATRYYIGIYDYWTKSYVRFADDTGTTEPLIVQATAANQIGSLAFSAAYPADVIYYDWNPANWLTDNSFIDDEGAIVTSFKGVIISRHDAVNDVFAPGDWRNCKTRRWKTDATAWNSGTTYRKGDIVSHAGTSMVYRACAVSTAQEPTGSDDAYWIILFDLSTYQYWNCNSTSWNGVPSGVDYDDFTLFATGQPKAIHIALDASRLAYTSSTILTGSVFFDGDTTYENRFEVGFGGNTVGANFSGNMVGADFVSNTVGDYFSGNTVGANFGGNMVGASFSYNTVGANFVSNTVGTNFGGNTVGANFSGNTVGANFVSNTVGDYFSGNTVGANFIYNDVASYAIQSIDLSAATHVYAAYNCWLYLDAGGGTPGPRLRYYTGDVATFAAVTA